MVGALARQLLRAESVASSRIEGLELSHRRLAKAAFVKGTDDVTAASVLSNMRAMDEAVRVSARATPLTAAALKKLHRILALAQLEAAKVLGRVNVGKRNRVWEALGLFELINAFEQHLATRQGRKTRMRPAPR